MSTFLAFFKGKAGALPRPPLLGGTKSGCAPTETEPVRKSNRVQPDFCPRCPTHGDQRDKKETPECPHADIPLPTFRCARLLRLVLASLVTPPPILTHTGVFWRTPTPPKKRSTPVSYLPSDGKLAQPRICAIIRFPPTVNVPVKERNSRL